MHMIPAQDHDSVSISVGLRGCAPSRWRSPAIVTYHEVYPRTLIVEASKLHQPSRTLLLALLQLLVPPNTIARSLCRHVWWQIGHDTTACDETE
jgi:hypothetical protein